MANDGLLAQFAPADEALPSDRVEITTIVRSFREPLEIQVTALDVDPGEMPGVDLFQVYAPIPIVIDDESIEDVVVALPEINELTPLIGFNVSLSGRFVYFRHIGVVDADTSEPRSVIETVWLAAFALEQHAPAIALLAGAVEEDDEHEDESENGR